MPYVVGGQFEQLPDWYRDVLRSFIEQSEALRQQPYPVYEGPRVAALPDYILKSYDLARQIGKHEPYYKRAHQLLEPEKGTYGEQLRQYMSPYIENVVEGIGKKGKRVFTEQILPALEAKFVKLGQHGSSRHKDLSLRAARDLEEAILERQQEALARGYEQASATRSAENLRNIEAARSLANLGGMAQQASQQDINLINALGAQQQAHRQQELNEQQAEFWRRMNWPQQQLAQQTAVLHGVPVSPTASTGFEYSAPKPIPQVNPMGQMGSMATQLYGLSQMGQRQYFKGGHIRKSPKKITLSSLKFAKLPSIKANKKLVPMGLF